MMSRHRLSLQLTPLLDLLLIVLFAQYMEVRDQARSQDADLTLRTAQLNEIEQTLEELLPRLAGFDEMQRQADLLRQMYAALEGQLGELQVEGESLALQNEILQEDLRQLESQREILGELISQLFQIPEERVAEIVDSQRIPPLSASQAELEQVRREFAEMARRTPSQMVLHLLTYHEIRKWCDVWELRIDRHFFTLRVGDEEYRRRLPVLASQQVDPAGVQQALFDVMKSAGPPKELVVILLTFDRSCLIDTEVQIRRLMPDLIAQYRANVPGNKQVHYADFGHGFE